MQMRFCARILSASTTKIKYHVYANERVGDDLMKTYFGILSSRIYIISGLFRGLDF